VAARLASTEMSRLTRRVALASVAVALGLVALKAWAWSASGSVAMMSSLADSALDLVASLFTFFAVRYAATPPDAEHRFGHGKAEAFAGLFQAGLVALSAVLIAIESARHLLDPRPVTQGVLAIGVIVASIVATGALVALQSWAVRQTGSVATKGDRAHYVADLGGNLAVLVGIAAAAFLGLGWADAAAGFFVAAWLGFGAYDVAREAADHLMDRELPDNDRARIIALAQADDGIGAVHELRTRTSGPYMHIQMHVELDPNLTLKAAHDLIVSAEERIRRDFPTADILIHPDPRGAAEPHGHEHFEPRGQGVGG
jgi:ferrous-iron efflux pump FieF